MESSQAFKVVKGLLAEWGACSRTVLLDNYPETLSYGNNTIAVGLHKDIAILDVITGSQTAVLSEHTDWVVSLAFSPDGTSLVSGSGDKTVKLWDMQTGGVVKTFYGHTSWVLSVFISPDCTRIASGSSDGVICLWNIPTGECKHVVNLQGAVHHICFSTIDPGHLVFISSSKVQQWDISGQKPGPAYDGSYIAFSSGHKQFALCSGDTITVQNSDSKAIVAEFHVPGGYTQCCCFSPDDRLLAAADGEVAYVWDIASSNPHLIETFIGHTKDIISIVFSSSCLISTSYDQSVKFWQIGTLSTGQGAINPKYTPPTSASIESLSLQTGEGIAISSDLAGLVKTWDILTGLHKASFQTPAEGKVWRDAQLIDGRLIFVWSKDDKIHIWDTGKSKLLYTLDASGSGGLRISGDGTKLFCLNNGLIQVWDMWTWKLVGEVKLEGDEPFLDSFCPSGSKIWVRFKDLSTQGWDFGTSDSPPIPLSKTFTERPHLDLIGGPLWQTSSPSWIKDRVTGKKVFQLSGGYVKFREVQWDGQYLVAGYKSGEVIILNFNHLGSQ